MVVGHRLLPHASVDVGLNGAAHDGRGRMMATEGHHLEDGTFALSSCASHQLEKITLRRFRPLAGRGFVLQREKREPICHYEGLSL